MEEYSTMASVLNQIIKNKASKEEKIKISIKK